MGVSSLIDTWIELRGLEFGAERTRTLFVRKSRGMAHSNQVREFLITNKGLKLVDVCVGPQGVLTGSARIAHQLNLRAGSSLALRKADSLRKQLHSRKAVVEARIAALNAELEAEIYAIESSFDLEATSESRSNDQRVVMAAIRNRNDSAAPRRKLEEK
jgi:circadian clock protein KaiC